MPKTTKTARGRGEFEFVQPSEFANPLYLFSIDGIIYGNIKYRNGKWLACMRDDFLYGSAIFIIMAAKADQLNADLDEQRKVFFGL